MPQSKNVANTAVTFRRLDSEELSMDTPLHSSVCCSFLVILQNQISLSTFRREFLDFQIKCGYLKQNPVRKMNPTDVSMETQEQLEASQETVHLKLLKLMHFSNYNISHTIATSSTLPIPKLYQTLYSNSGLGFYMFFNSSLWYYRIRGLHYTEKRQVSNF